MLNFKNNLYEEKRIHVSYDIKNEKLNDIITIQFKGKFKPLETNKYYDIEIKNLQTDLQKCIERYFQNLHTIQPLFIITTNFTEKGIKPKKSFKYKFKIIFKPKNKLSLYDNNQIIQNIIENVIIMFEDLIFSKRIELI